MYQHPQAELRYIRTMWRMAKRYHLSSIQRQREKGNMPDIRADIIASAYEAGHEAGGQFDFAVCQEKFRAVARRWFSAGRIFRELPDFRGRNDCPNKIAPILSYYELDTFDGTCQKFGLKPTQKLRKLFSQACPKPELGKQNGTGGNNAERVEIEPGLSARQVMDRYGVSKPTAWRARKRGYLYKPAGRVGGLENLFSAKEVMNALLNSEHRQEVISTLAVSETYSFYFEIEGVRYRVSNHAPRHWQQRLGEKRWVDISPAGDPADKDKLLNSISSQPQKQASC